MSRHFLMSLATGDELRAKYLKAQRLLTLFANNFFARHKAPPTINRYVTLISRREFTPRMFKVCGY